MNLRATRILSQLEVAEASTILVVAAVAVVGEAVVDEVGEAVDEVAAVVEVGMVLTAPENEPGRARTKPVGETTIASEDMTRKWRGLELVLQLEMLK